MPGALLRLPCPCDHEVAIVVWDCEGCSRTACARRPCGPQAAQGGLMDEAPTFMLILHAA